MSAAAGRYTGKKPNGNVYGNYKKNNINNTKKNKVPGGTRRQHPGNAPPVKKSADNIRVRKNGAQIKSFMSAVFMIMTIAALFLFLTNRYFFKIKNITISENDKYSYEEILGASGVAEGNELYGVDIIKIKENMKNILTYAYSINITRIPPSNLNIDIKTEKGLFGIMLGGDYYIISRNFRVVEKIKIVGNSNSSAGPGFIPPDGIITFETGAVKRCFVGEKIEFADDDVSGFLTDIAKLTEDGGDKVADIKNINIANKFKVVMNYGDKFLVKFGVFENITSKILNSFEIIKQLPDYAEGVIDMTNEKVASFRYEENIAKLYKTGKDKSN